MADKAHVLTDEKLEQMERKLSAIYSEAQKSVGKEWDSYLKQSNKEIDELQKLYDKSKKENNQKEIKKYGIKLAKAKKKQTLLNSRYKAVAETTAENLAHVNERALAYINGQLPEVYSINYNALAETVDGVGGYSFLLVDENTVRNLILNDSSLLPTKDLDIPADIRWNVKKMNAQVLQGILTGDSMDKIAMRLMNVVDMNASAAIRNARTMVTGAENKGRLDSYEKATADGIILQKEWLSSDDKRTRHTHLPKSAGGVGGEIVDHDKPFPNGLMFPGDASGDPSEVYNCRCSMAAVVKGFDRSKFK